MPQFTYPGVYIEELSSGVHTITGVATSIAAFVGWAPQGSTTEAVLVQSWMDFARQYGGLDSRSLLGYSVSQFFNNGGQQAYIIRLVSGVIPAGSTATTATSASTTVAVPGSTTASPLTLTFTASSTLAGATGNSYGIQITFHAAGSAANSGTIDVAVVYAPSGSALVVLESFTGLTMADLVSTVNGSAAGSTGSKFVKAASSGAGTFAAPQKDVTSLFILAGGSDGNGIGIPGATAASVTIDSPGSTTLGFTFSAQNPGAWGNLLAIGTSPQPGDATNTRFGLNVVAIQPDGSLSVVETYNNLSISKTDPQYVVTVINADSNYVTAAVATGGAATAALNTPFPPASPGSAPFSDSPAVFLSGGTDGPVLDPTQDGTSGGGAFTTALNADGSGTGGVRLLDTVSIFNLLCVPGEMDSVVIGDLQKYCRDKRAFYIVDGLGASDLSQAPSASSPTKMISSGPVGIDGEQHLRSELDQFGLLLSVGPGPPPSGGQPAQVFPSVRICGGHLRRHRFRSRGVESAGGHRRQSDRRLGTPVPSH